MPCLFWLLLLVLCCWFWWLCWAQCPHCSPDKDLVAEGNSPPDCPSFFVVCSFTPQQTHYSPLMNTRCLLTDWQSATPHGIIEPLSTAYLSSRRLQPHMCHGSEPVVTACSYFPQLLTIALYLRDSIWSKLDSIVFWACGLFDATGRGVTEYSLARGGDSAREDGRSAARVQLDGQGRLLQQLSEDVHFRQCTSLSLKETSSWTQVGFVNRLFKCRLSV